jgi:hypothetical protein
MYVKYEIVKKLKKNILLSILITLSVLAAVNTKAQRSKVLNLPTYNQQPYHFGFILAANQMLFSIKPADNLQNIKFTTEQSPDIYADSLFVYGVTSTPTPGFSIGILGNLLTGKYVDFRFIPSLSFGERLLNYKILAYKNDTSFLVNTQKSVTSTYVEFPFIFKYRSKRLNNMNAYVLGGIQYSIDLASRKKASDNETDVSIKLKRHDIYAEVGVGFDFYTNYFKFGTELKMGYGLNNILLKEDNIYSGSIDFLRSKVFMLSFTFE